MLPWKTHNSGKTHGSPQAAEYTMREKITAMEAQGQRPLAPPSSPHAAVTVEATTSLSLSHTVSIHTLYTTNFTKCNNKIYKKCVP